jgi:hypothetical protein
VILKRLFRDSPETLVSVKKRFVYALDEEKSVDGEMGTMPISDASEPGMANKRRPSMDFSESLVHQKLFFSALSATTASEWRLWVTFGRTKVT